jgi:hypothetical protein
VSKQYRFHRSLVRRLVSNSLVRRLGINPLARKVVSNSLIFDLALAAACILAFASFQEAPPGTWALIRRLIGRW